MSRRDDYVAKMKLELDDLNAKLGELEAKAAQAKHDARDKYAQEVEKARTHSREAVAKLEEIKAAGEGSWEKLMDEMDKLRHAFTQSFHYFKSQV